MNEIFNNIAGKKIHFVGIKGTGMVALVEILLSRGAVISGSDVSERFYTDEILDKYNLKALPFSENNITSDISLVIYSSAYSPDKNPDLIAAERNNIPMLLYTQALGKVSESAYSCGICGVHGKTTTTGLTGTILKNLPLSSQVLAGSIISSFGNSCTVSRLNNDEKKYFVAETCEYQRHFMSFCPKKIILTSVESDHQDYYPTYEDIRDAFVDYVLKLPENGHLIFCADDKGAVEVAEIVKEKRSDIQFIPYGFDASGDYKIEAGEILNGVQNFSLGCLKNLSIRVPGIHNIRNSCAAVALNMLLLEEDGKNPFDYEEQIRSSLLEFAGGKRRSEILGKRFNSSGKEIIFIDDYGHHPTAINTTLKGFKDFYSEYKIIVDFMSHTYTRTAALLDEFASSFGSSDVVIINKIYGSARENAGAANVNGAILAERTSSYHKNVFHAEEFDEAEKVAFNELEKNPGDKKGYVFVSMGAGDNWKISVNLMKKFREA